ncbi:hypothetical protein EX30DRAFT_374480 [Ascodesmis nigricans]|uniref:Uncharacterized protein n=1 Tax=Ascodesmis nigricans TaxID=341454 RepID=A0A4S2ML81_9PEZI|nr:hypothetical protein EX30DRAFT_374480 [Ascodesmis nigricans]
MSVAVDDGRDPPSLEVLTRNLTRHVLSATAEDPECCCGKDSCQAVLKTKRMVEEMQGKVELAGQVGKAMLREKEDSKMEAEKREQDLLAHIDNLEHQSARLENANVDILAQNRMLRQNLEDLEADMKMSETKVKEMQEALDETHAELSRVAARAARADVLEARLSILENEQEELRNTIITTREEERAATARWRKSERALQELEEQLERITHEHAMEKARSRNILERLEQQQRSTSVTTRTSGSTAASCVPGAYEKASMSRFVKEILAENGHLQIGIAELRELLAASQEEVKNLRDKIENNLTSPPNTPAIDLHRQPLSMELERTPTGSVQTVVHHHHYHPPPVKEKLTIAVRPTTRRTNRRRKPFPSTDFGPSSANRLPGAGLNNSPPTPNPFAKRWSHASKASTSSTVPSSFPTSPSSTYQASIFDRFDTEDSRPTSAGSDFDPKAWQRYSNSSFAHYTHTRNSSASSIPSHLPGHQPPFQILHTTEEHENETSDNEGISHNHRATSSPSSSRPTLRRTLSHESILSTISTNPLTLNLHPPNFTVSPAVSTTSTSSIAHRPTRPGIPTLPSSTSDGPSAVITPGIAIRTVDSGRGDRETAYSRLLGLQVLRQEGSPPKGSQKDGSGWWWKWGASMKESRLPGLPISVPGVLGRSQPQNTVGIGAADSMKAVVGRMKSVKRANTEPVKKVVDVDGLREALGEGER